jgi:hypothetical protein
VVVLSRSDGAWEPGQRFDKVVDTQTAQIQEMETRVILGLSELGSPKPRAGFKSWQADDHTS